MEIKREPRFFIKVDGSNDDSSNLRKCLYRTASDPLRW